MFVTSIYLKLKMDRGGDEHAKNRIRSACVVDERTCSNWARLFVHRNLSEQACELIAKQIAGNQLFKYHKSIAECLDTSQLCAICRAMQIRLARSA